MLRNVLLVFTTFLLVASLSLAGDHILVDGFGKTRHNAIINALIQTVNKNEKANEAEIEKEIDNLNTQMPNTSGSLEIALTENFEKEIRKITKGLIISYTIENEIKHQEGYEVRLSINLGQYQPVDERSKLNMYKVAIVPFNVKQDAINAGDTTTSVVKIGLEEAIKAQFTQSRKFRIVNRNEDDEAIYQSEIKKINSSTSAEEKLKLGQKIGADFILTGDVLALSINEKKSSYYGENFANWRVSATVSYRVIELATMEVKWSNTVTVSLPSSEANEYIEANNGSLLEVENRLYHKIGKEIADQVIGAIYPLSVLSVVDNNIYLNQGGERVKRGSIYTIRYSIGTVEDSSTGQHTVLDSKPSAKIRVIDVMPKYSIAEVIEGGINNIQKGDRAYLSN
ncbi:CsgG/HfaB family protein [Pseudofrancisella aestuarii]|uniref:CsgG/HfaB family protein n=1 Tax=Pseudofrancisella aestuarii TaxID=2670347 RepID=A0ABV9TC22_9GAMM|nr:CsgG/HfaB family protein [Pseudofrancisella aestuarii]